MLFRSDNHITDKVMIGFLAVDHHLVGDVVVVRSGMCHVVGPQRAARQNSTITTNKPPHASARKLRRSRSHTRYQGLRPWICAAATPVGSGGSPVASTSPTGVGIAVT